MRTSSVLQPIPMGEGAVTVSGTVTSDASAPLARTVRLHDRHGNLLQTTTSNPITGAWSMIVNGSALDRFEVVVMGDLDAGDEQSVIYNNL